MMSVLEDVFTALGVVTSAYVLFVIGFMIYAFWWLIVKGNE